MKFRFAPATLLRVANFIIFLDVLLMLVFIGGVFYIATTCPDLMIEHVTFLLHFVQALAILGATDDWRSELRENEMIKSHTPYVWIAASVLSLIGDITLLVYQLTGAHSCSGVNTLHIVMDSTGIVICLISIVWFIAVYYTVKAAKCGNNDYGEAEEFVYDKDALGKNYF